MDAGVQFICVLTVRINLFDEKFIFSSRRQDYVVMFSLFDIVQLILGSETDGYLTVFIRY